MQVVSSWLDELPWYASPFRPDLEEACRQLHASIVDDDRVDARVDLSDPAVFSSLLDPLLFRLYQISHRTLALEINAARILGKLAGETPEERFQNYVRRLPNEAGRAELFAEYPLLAQYAREGMDQWLETTREFLGRLRDSGPLLEEAFGPLGRFMGFGKATGDCHQGGRQVSIARFESGVRVVYKP